MPGTILGSPINFALANLLAPASGVTHALRVALSLSGGSVSIPMTSLVQLVGSDYQPQSMTVDNTTSSAAVTINETTYGWTRTIGAGATRTFQFPSIPGAVFVFASAGNATPTLSFYDWPAFPDGDQIPGASGGSVTIAGPLPLPVTFVAGVKTYAAVTGATSVTTAGTAVVVFPGGSIPNKGTIYNPSGAPGILYADAVNSAQTASPGTAGTTVEIQPGGAWIFDNASGNITANSLTSGHAFAAFTE